VVNFELSAIFFSWVLNRPSKTTVTQCLFLLNPLAHSIVFKMERCPEEICDDQEEREVIFSQTSATETESNPNLSSLDNSELPSWASRHSHSQDLESSMLAECEVSIMGYLPHLA